MKVASFFAGIGGFDLGMERAGHKTVYQCEISPFCRKVLAHHWPDAERATDIKEVRGADLPGADIWTAGFPCQDLSVARGAAGRPGLAGARSGLFFEFARLAGECLPPVIILENVPGLLTANRGDDFAAVLRSLAGCGYALGWRVLDSRYFGVPQSRRRVYVAGCLGNPSRAAEILFEREGGGGDTEPVPGPLSGGQAADELEADGGRTWARRTGYCLTSKHARGIGRSHSTNLITTDGKVRRITPLEAERMQGFPAGWTLVDGAADAPRYRAIGNAVTVPVAQWLGERIQPG